MDNLSAVEKVPAELAIVPLHVPAIASVLTAAGSRWWRPVWIWRASSILAVILKAMSSWKSGRGMVIVLPVRLTVTELRPLSRLWYYRNPPSNWRPEPGMVIVTVCLDTTGSKVQFGGSLAASRNQPSTIFSLPTAAPQTPEEDVDASGWKPEKSTPVDKIDRREFLSLIFLHPGDAQAGEIYPETVLPIQRPSVHGARNNARPDGMLDAQTGILGDGNFSIGTIGSGRV